MANKLIGKVLSFIGFDEVYDDEELIEEEEKVDQEVQRDEEPKNRKGAQVFSLHTQKQMKVVIMEPKSFDESQAIADQLKNHRPVIVNLEQSERNLAKRIVDFVSGTTYALNGNMQKVGNSIFLFVPNNVDIAGEAKEEVERNLFWSVVGQK